MKILHIATSMNPEGGGPSEGIRQLGMMLQSMGHQSECLTADPVGGAWLQNEPIKVHAVGPGHLGTYSYCPPMADWLRANAHNYDRFVVNGLWQHHSFIARSVLKELGFRYYIFTHGMLDPWFRRAYPVKHIKKWIYWPWGEYRVLRDAEAVLFTCEEERLLASQSFWLYSAKEKVVPYGTSEPPPIEDGAVSDFLSTYPELAGKQVFLFLGRIHAKKGLDLLIEAFAQLKSIGQEAHLIIAGPDKTSWRPALEELAHSLGVARKITWAGMLQGRMKWAAFRAADVFILPSHQENFGIAVAEALGCGLPVLISNKVNIWREILDAQCGLVRSDTSEGTLEMMQEWLELGLAERQQMRVKAVLCFRKHFAIASLAEEMVKIFSETTESARKLRQVA